MLLEKIAQSRPAFQICLILLEGPKTQKDISNALIVGDKISQSTSATLKILKPLEKAKYIQIDKTIRPKRYIINHNSFYNSLIRGIIGRRNDLAKNQFRSQRINMPYKKHQKSIIRKHLEVFFLKLKYEHPQQLNLINNFQELYDAYIDPIKIFRWSEMPSNKIMSEWLQSVHLERGRADLIDLMTDIRKEIKNKKKIISSPQDSDITFQS